MNVFKPENHKRKARRVQAQPAPGVRSSGLVAGGVGSRFAVWHPACDGAKKLAMLLNSTPSKPAEIEIVISGFRLAARVWGTEAAPCVLALHGWLDNAASFDGLAPLLPELRLLALDLPGHGLSQHRAAGQAYHFVDWLPVVFEVADALGLNQFSLMGHSMGAGIAALAAGAVPERIERLVLLEGLGPSVIDDVDVPDTVRQHLEQRARQRNAQPRVYPSLQEAASALTRAMRGLSFEAALKLASRGTRQVSSGVTWNADPRLKLRSMHRFNEAQVQAFLRRISAKSLLVYADHGHPFDRMVMQRRREQLQDLELYQVKGAHHVHLDQPERVAPVVRQFFGLG